MQSAPGRRALTSKAFARASCAARADGAPPLARNASSSARSSKSAGATSTAIPALSKSSRRVALFEASVGLTEPFQSDA